MIPIKKIHDKYPCKREPEKGTESHTNEITAALSSKKRGFSGCKPDCSVSRLTPSLLEVCLTGRLWIFWCAVSVWCEIILQRARQQASVCTSGRYPNLGSEATCVFMIYRKRACVCIMRSSYITISFRVRYCTDARIS